MGLEKGHLVKWSLPLAHIPAQVFFLCEWCFLLCKLRVEILEPLWGVGAGGGGGGFNDNVMQT